MRFNPAPGGYGRPTGNTEAYFYGPYRASTLSFGKMLNYIRVYGSNRIEE